jgi:hypothetical protein
MAENNNAMNDDDKETCVFPRCRSTAKRHGLCEKHAKQFTRARAKKLAAHNGDKKYIAAWEDTLEEDGVVVLDNRGFYMKYEPKPEILARYESGELTVDPEITQLEADLKETQAEVSKGKNKQKGRL